MSASEDLEKFREDWKKELKKSRSVPENTTKGSKEIDSSSQGKEENKHSIQEKRNAVEICVNQSNIDNVRKRKNTLQPFLIAENLLEGKSSFSSCKKSKPSTSDLQEESPSTDEKQPTILDIFLNDLNEINEIPFFDTQLPREVALRIFKHLDVKDLCSCSQVSPSWRSLAEDELLWCNICHKLGHEQDAQTAHKQDWKSIVKQHVIKHNHIIYNWKNRIGQCSHLQYAKGGILSSVSSHEKILVSGYSNGDVKLWDLQHQDDCILSPSRTALVLHEEGGTVSNTVKQVAVNQTHTVAAYTQGNIDIWSNDEGRSPMYTITNRDSVDQLALMKDKLCVAASHDHYLTITNQSDDVIKTGEPISFDQKLSFLHWLDPSDLSTVAVAGYDWIKLVHQHDNEHSMTTLQHTLENKVTALDVAGQRLACGLLQYDLVSHGQEAQVRLYDLTTHRELGVFEGHTWTVAAINMESSLPHSFCTGSADKKVHVYDDRMSEAVHVFRGHSASVTRVRMDDWKVISGAEDGLLCVWDQRMDLKLWEVHNRHPVRFIDSDGALLVTAHIPQSCQPTIDCDDDKILPLRYRGSLHVYDFSSELQMAAHIPSICLSTYDEPMGYNYNINLAMPYDKL